jgi:hypothetical protein
MLPAGSRKAQSRTPYGWSVGSWTTSAPLACTRSNAPSTSLLPSSTVPYVPLAIISVIVRRSSSVMPGVTAGGDSTMLTSGWAGGPTVIQCSPL